MDILPTAEVSKYIIIGEIGLDGAIIRTGGVLPASVWANANGYGIICPGVQGGEARWAGHTNILAPNHVLELINHFRGTQILPLPQTMEITTKQEKIGDLSEVHGQEAAKRALEIAAAGGHNVLMVGVPGSGKTMLAKRMSSILPEMTRAEALEVTKIYSIAGKLPQGRGRGRTGAGRRQSVRRGRQASARLFRRDETADPDRPGDLGRSPAFDP